MRKLQATDIFAFCRVVNAIGIKEEIKEIAMKATNLSDVNVEELGFNLIFAIFEKATQKKAEQELFEFFAGIFEMKTEEAMKLDPVDFLDRVMEAADVEKWKVFFRRVASLMKQS